MLRISIALFAGLLFAACTTQPTEETKAAFPEIQLTESLAAYALSPIDSVYCLKIEMQCDSSTVVNYIATVQYNERNFSDSLIITLPAGSPVRGQLIFAECPAGVGEKT
jgi:hypothetical protein